MNSKLLLQFDGKWSESTNCEYPWTTQPGYLTSSVVTDRLTRSAPATDSRALRRIPKRPAGDSCCVAGRREGCAKLSCSWQAKPEPPPRGFNGGYQPIPMGYNGVGCFVKMGSFCGDVHENWSSTRGFGWIWGTCCTCCTCIKKLLCGICVKLVAKYGDVPIKMTDAWNVKTRENPSNAPTSPGTMHYVALLCTNHATWPTLSRCICTYLAVEGSLVMFCSRSGGRSQVVLENMVPLSRDVLQSCNKGGLSTDFNLWNHQRTQNHCFSISYT